MTATPTTAAGAVLPLGAEWTIAHAAGHHAWLVGAVDAATGHLQLDLGAVTDFDSSGVQLLLSARRSLAARGHALQIVTASAVVRDALALFGLAALLDAAPAGHAAATGDA